eukprot:CAMPEP_0172912094 /NCGR_PEP_ID=MMETSP1075-20121228/187798_1 /TAXON_ID=2916 /ORGANISM="Ceratium fusus, Strain PA161109" /LENGTH=52 /DNA_ID=CAMNT_0013770517 /DNA_START=98 /DNA_END=252 /DNA_ORIENTATION=-
MEECEACAVPEFIDFHIQSVGCPCHNIREAEQCGRVIAHQFLNALESLFREV